MRLCTMLVVVIAGGGGAMLCMAEERFPSRTRLHFTITFDFTAHSTTTNSHDPQKV